MSINFWLIRAYINIYVAYKIRITKQQQQQQSYKHKISFYYKRVLIFMFLI